MSPLSLWAARALTPDRELERVRLRAESGLIVELVANVEPAASDERFPDGTLVPGLVDLQVNGGGGAAYDAHDAETRACATAFHLRSGTTSLLATLVSAPLDALEASLERLVRDADPAGPVLGVHLEGPFLCEEKAGAHAPGVLLDPTPDAVERLIASAGGALRMVTLAPERAGAGDAIRRFVAAGALVAAGHSGATYAQVREAMEAGLSFVTHVGNASDWPTRRFDPELGYRRSEPGLVGSFLIETGLRGSVILDGRHLHPGLARALVELKGPENLVLVSDASPAAGLPPGRYELGGLESEVHAGGYATSGEGLAGSVVSLREVLQTAVSEAGLSLAVALRMATSTPAALIGAKDRKGALNPGWDADLLVLDRELRAQAVYHAGQRIADGAST